MHVLVTGASGYIGSHVCEILAEHNVTVTGLDNHFHGEYNDVSKYCTHWIDADVNHTLEPAEYDAVVHLAGRTVVPESIKHPFDYYQTNVIGTQNVLDAVTTPHFLFASTSSAWEMASPYAISKVAAEQVIRAATPDYTIFRFFNVSGSNGVNRQLGASSHLIRVAAEVATGKRSVLEIYGNDYATADGTCVRDYVHVCDVAAAIYRAIIAGPQRTPYESLGSNCGYSVLDVVDCMQRVCSTTLPTQIMPRREGDAVSCIATDVSQLMKRKYSLEDMCSSQLALERSK